MSASSLRGLSRLLVPLVLAACQDSAADRAERRGGIDSLSDGAGQVRNVAVGMWGNDDGWSLVEEVRLGTLDMRRPELFGDVRGLQADDDGCIYPDDAQAREVRVVGAGVDGSA